MVQVQTETFVLYSSVYSTNKIMKIITVAFIFQFLLSCWPKVDIILRMDGIKPFENE